ncbi:hypothetical protein pb186bvf_000532 [Paramecium bursaria]
MFKELQVDVQKLINQTKNDINKRDAMKNKPTALIDAEINGQIRLIDSKLDQINIEILDYQKNPQKYDMLAKEIQRRRNIYQEFQNQRQELKVKHDLLNPRKNEKKYYGSTDLLQLHQDVTAQQDEALIKINEQASNIKLASIKMHNQIQEQGKLIEQLDGSSSLDQMMKLKYKMQQFSQQSSSCGLLSIIALELMILLMIIIV